MKTQTAIHLLVSLGCLVGLAPALAQVPANKFDYSRSAGFSYYPNGTLKTQTAEPAYPQLCTVSTYNYDAFGNVASTIATNCAGATGSASFVPRSSSTTFGAVTGQLLPVNGSNVPVNIAPGVVQTRLENGLLQQETRQVDPRFNVNTLVTGPNNTSASTVLDSFGRKVRENSEDGTNTRTAYCILSATGLDSSSNSPECAGISTSDAPSLAAFLVYSEARDTLDNKMGPWVKTYQDRLGRIIRRSTQGFDGSGQPGAVASSAIVTDSVYNDFGAKYLETAPYFLATKSATSSGSNVISATLSAFDVLGRPVASYRTDPQGSTSQTLGGSTIEYGSYGTRQVAKTLYAHSGHTSTVTNDKGQVRVEQRNAAGEPVRVTDANGAQVTFLRDAFANVISTWDPLQNETVSVYDYRGRRTQVQDPDRGLTLFAYNALGEAVTQQNPKQTAGTAVQYAYDALGRMTQRTEPEYTTTWFHDKYGDNSACAYGIGRVCEVRTSNLVKRRFVYDAAGRATSERTDITGGPSFVTARTFEARTGRLASKVYPTGLQVTYGYTPLGFSSQLKLGTAATLNAKPSTVGGSAPAAYALAAGTVLWQQDKQSADGAAEQVTLANGISNLTTLDPSSGRVTAQLTSGGSTSVVNQSYGWDSVNNLISRTDAIGDGSGNAVTESFQYDTLNRLKHYDVSAPTVAGTTRAVDITYNAAGMMLTKSDVGTYAYPPSGPGAVKPHLVTSITRAGVTTSYSSDANGNIISANGGAYRSLSFNTFDQPDGTLGIAGPGGDTRYLWGYDENHARIRETRTIASGTAAGTRTTWYLQPDNVGGLGFERDVNVPTSPSASNPAVASNRHFLTANGTAIGVLVSEGDLPVIDSAQLTAVSLPNTTTYLAAEGGVFNVSGTQTVRYGAGTYWVQKSVTNNGECSNAYFGTDPIYGTYKTCELVGAPALLLKKLEYWHKDHLGSLLATSNHLGGVTARYSYDPFGKRRFTGGNYDANGVVQGDWNSTVDNGTARGFTGHENLDDIGIINMNGRQYDPTIASFLQADPVVGAPTNSQNYNRYAYLSNNPLNGTDPSGFFGETQRPELKNITGSEVNQNVSAGAGSSANVAGGSSSSVRTVTLERVTVVGKRVDPGSDTFNVGRDFMDGVRGDYSVLSGRSKTNWVSAGILARNTYNGVKQTGLFLADGAEGWYAAARRASGFSYKFVARSELGQAIGAGATAGELALDMVNGTVGGVMSFALDAASGNSQGAIENSGNLLAIFPLFRKVPTLPSSFRMETELAGFGARQRVQFKVRDHQGAFILFTQEGMGVVVSDLYKGKGPLRGSTALAASLDQAGISRPQFMAVTTIVNEDTVAQLKAGVPPGETLMGRTMLSTIRQLGGEPAGPVSATPHPAIGQHNIGPHDGNTFRVQINWPR